MRHIYARDLADWRRRVPQSLRNVQGGGVPLEGVCAVLRHEGIYHGDAHDLDAFGEWLTALVEKKRGHCHSQRMRCPCAT